MATPVDGDDVDLELLRACYHAFLQRRLERGALSIRTKQGYERLREKYQQRLRFLQDAAINEDPRPPLPTKPTHQSSREASAEEEQGEPQPKAVRAENETERERYSDEEDDVEQHRPATILHVPAPEIPSSPLVSSTASESEASALLQLVGVFFDARVKRCLLDICWPLAHHGGRGDHPDKKPTPEVPEWQELEQHKYFAYMFNTLVWLFPGLPTFEAQEQAERDWKKDCEFDAFGSYGLSFEGFMVSMLDLALACTDGSIEKSIEFFTHMAKRLEESLPPFRAPVHDSQPPEDSAALSVPALHAYEKLVWRGVPLEQLFPCPVRVRPQFLELKVKLSAAPIVLMVLAGKERSLELQLSTSAKLLVRERDHRSSIRRNTMHTQDVSHFIEIEKQFLWTFRSFPGRPTLLVIPGNLVSRRTLSLFACCRLLESHEHHQREQPSDSDSFHLDPGLPLLTFFTAVHDPFPLAYGIDHSLCGRIDRQSSRLFLIDHRERCSSRFKITFKTSLIHNTSAGGGAGAAAVLASVAQLDSVGTAKCASELVGDTSRSSASSSPHSFIFIMQMSPEILAQGPRRSRTQGVTAAKTSNEAEVPPQWFTSLCGANENKTIFIDVEDGQEAKYFVYVFTLHGFYFEATYEDCEIHEDATAKPSADDEREALLLHRTHGRDLRRTTDQAGSVLVNNQGDDDGELGIDRLNSVAAPGSAGVRSLTNSATLLRQLLLLRKQRQHQAQAEPPPECVGGAKITNMKVVSAAAGLRAKFLRARAIERRARFLQNEDALRAKVLAKLMKAEAKKRGLRGHELELLPAAVDDQDAAEAQPQDDPVMRKELDAKATMLASFFKEMAVYHPTQKELDQAKNEAKGEAEQEDELLEHFADLFDDDHALQNMLDAEKWLTADERTKRRQELVDDRREKRRQSLVTLKEEDVMEATRLEMAEPSKPRRASSAAAVTQRASEDYVNTAMLIQQLMQEADEEERGVHAEKTTKEDDAALAQLAASWEYAAYWNATQQRTPRRPYTASHCSSPSAKMSRIDCDPLEQLEKTRHDQWLTSHYIQDVGIQARLASHHGSLRPTLVPYAQTFHEQEQHLPWQPMWEVQVDASAVDEAPDTTRRPELQRPSTAAAGTSSVLSSRPPQAVSPCSVPVKSATFARFHTRRIKSARIGHRLGCPDPTKTTSRLTHHGTQVNGAGDISSLSEVMIPRAFIVDGIAGFEENTLPPPVEAGEGGYAASTEDEMPLECAGPFDAADDALMETREPTVPKTSQKATVRRKKKRKKQTREEKRFSQRVQELLSITPFGTASH